MADYPLVNKEYEKYFNGVFPARTCIAVKGLPLNGFFHLFSINILLYFFKNTAKIEIEMVATQST